MAAKPCGEIRVALSVVNRLLKTVIMGSLPLVGLLALLSQQTIPGTNIALTVPYAAQGTGPTYNTLGDYENSPVVNIHNATTYPTDGHLNMTTVSVHSGMTLPQAVSMWFTGDYTFVPIDQVLPRNRAPEEIAEENKMAFSVSENSASIAAMRHLNIPTLIQVAQVQPDSAAYGVLEAGMVIKAVDGNIVDQAVAVQQLVQSHAPGDTLTLTVIEHPELGPEFDPTKAATSDIAVTLGANPYDESKAFLGIFMQAVAANGMSIDYNLEGIGGPSAGMMFALAVIDKLTPEEITHGKFIAGTGTIDNNGNVGPIGGIEYKVKAANEAGAEVFLAPERNCAEAVKRPHEGTTIIPVTNVTQALEYLEAYNEGGEYPTCD